MSKASDPHGSASPSGRRPRTHWGGGGRLYIPTGLGTPQDLPGGAEDVTEEKDVWAFSA